MTFAFLALACSAISVFLSALKFGLCIIGLELGSGSNTAVVCPLATPIITLLHGRCSVYGLRCAPVRGGARRWSGSSRLGGMSVEPLATWFVVGSALAYAFVDVLAKRHGPFHA